MSEYAQELKDSMNVMGFIKNHQKEEERIKNELEIIKTKELTIRIKKLPKELRKHIYIFSMKFFYRNYLLETPRFTLYNNYMRHIGEMKKKVIIDNVHILHLECNTLPENKRYIMGCQCGYCKGVPREIKDEVYNSVDGRLSEFIKSIGSLEGSYESFCNGVVSPSEFYDYDYNTYSFGYNFTKDGFYSHLEDKTLESPIYFSKETVDFINLKLD
jgi:hypothetical protein